MIRLLHRSWVGPSATIDSLFFFIIKLSRYDVVNSIRLVAVFEYSIPRLPCVDWILDYFRNANCQTYYNFRSISYLQNIEIRK